MGIVNCHHCENPVCCLLKLIINRWQYPIWLILNRLEIGTYNWGQYKRPVKNKEKKVTKMWFELKYQDWNNSTALLLQFIFVSISLWSSPCEWHMRCVALAAGFRASKSLSFSALLLTSESLVMFSVESVNSPLKWGICE